MNLGIRAILYSARKWKKTLLVFCLLLAITTLVLSGLAIADAQEEQAWAVRDHHQELSGLFLKKYGHILDFPSDAYLHAVIQVCRGHRRTDLLDEAAYPPRFEVEPGKAVCLPYLAALLCLADELDIAAGRNISFLYDVERMPSPRDRREFRKHMAIYRVDLEPDRVVVHARTEDPEIRAGVRELCAKLLDKLLLCRRVAAERSPFVITQAGVALELEPAVGEEAEP